MMMTSPARAAERRVEQRLDTAQLEPVREAHISVEVNAPPICGSGTATGVRGAGDLSPLLIAADRSDDSPGAGLHLRRGLVPNRLNLTMVRCAGGSHVC